MRQLVVVLSLVLALAAAASAATGVPGLPRLAVGDSRFVPVPGPAPTGAQCIRAWNGHAPRVALRWIGGLRPFGAQMRPNTTYFQSSSTGGKIIVGPMCGLLVFYAHTKLLDISGIWKGGRVSVWFGDLRTSHDNSASLNATVGSDGRLHAFVTVHRQVPATIPGLPDPADTTDPAYTPSPGLAPTAAQCVRVWNSHAPRVTVDWIAGLRPYGALVYTFKNTVRNNTVTVIGADCAFEVYFGHEQYLQVNGVWKNGDVSAWSGELGTNKPLRDTGQNAAVAADGTIHLH